MSTYSFTPEELTYYNQLEQGYQDILANPDHWDQHNWHCGTSHCLGGFCDIREAGLTLEEEFIPASYSPFATRYPQGWGAYAEIFSGYNNLEEIREILDHIKENGFAWSPGGINSSKLHKLEDVGSTLDVVAGIKQAIEFTWNQEDEPVEEFRYSSSSIDFLKNYAYRFYNMLDALWPLPGTGAVIKRKNISSHDTTECLGHDIWYTTQGHGCGFWEGDSRWIGHWKACDDFCEANPIGEAYLGDDGLVYLLGAEQYTDIQ